MKAIAPSLTVSPSISAAEMGGASTMFGNAVRSK